MIYRILSMLTVPLVLLGFYGVIRQMRKELPFRLRIFRLPRAGAAHHGTGVWFSVGSGDAPIHQRAVNRRKTFNTTYRVLGGLLCHHPDPGDVRPSFVGRGWFDGDVLQHRVRAGNQSKLAHTSTATALANHTNAE
jgi:hypothetical protein